MLKPSRQRGNLSVDSGGEDRDITGRGADAVEGGLESGSVQTEWWKQRKDSSQEKKKKRQKDDAIAIQPDAENGRDRHR